MPPASLNVEQFVHLEVRMDFTRVAEFITREVGKQVCQVGSMTWCGDSAAHLVDEFQPRARLALQV
jgi:hypothetical protein